MTIRDELMDIVYDANNPHYGDYDTQQQTADAILEDFEVVPRTDLPRPDSTDPEGRIYFANHTIRVDRSSTDRRIEIYSERAGGWAAASIPRFRVSTLARLAALRAAEAVR